MTPETNTNEEVVLRDVEEVIDEFIKTIPAGEFLPPLRPSILKDDNLPF